MSLVVVRMWLQSGTVKCSMLRWRLNLRFELLHHRTALRLEQLMAISEIWIAVPVGLEAPVKHTATDPKGSSLNSSVCYYEQVLLSNSSLTTDSSVILD